MNKVTGRVTAHGDAASAAVVELHNSAGDIIDQVQVDGDGGFAFHLAPGTWSMRVWDPHGHRGTAEVTLAEDEDRTVDIALDEPHGGHGEAP